MDKTGKKYAAIKKVVKDGVETYYISAFYDDKEQWGRMMDDLGESKIMVCVYEEGDPEVPYEKSYTQFYSKIQDEVYQKLEKK